MTDTLSSYAQEGKAAIAGGRATAFAGSIARESVSQMRSDLPVYLLVGVLWFAGFVFLSAIGQWEQAKPFLYIEVMLPLLTRLLPVLLIAYVWVTILRRAGRRRMLAYRMVATPVNLARFVSGMVLATAFCLFMGIFTAIKGSLGTWLGFTNDVWQADLDKALFLSNDPWKVLFEPLHSVPLQQAVEFNYNVSWHLITFTLLSATFYLARDPHLRNRYIGSFILTWFVIGNVFAGLFISAGPAYYGLVTGDEARFGPQLQMLAQYAESSAIQYQNYLWHSYESGVAQFGTGISAFPSVHVGVTVLNALFAFEFSRRLGMLAAAYSVFVWFSSVYLAWHYAIDGLFSAFAVFAIYHALRKAGQFYARRKPA